mmetsp:Transcript_16392/g.41376  ORF Transcript_16392/g.41376 Transcript_16392/m.41376 type:complete len:193 (+) Transcript_16392:328-906(+)
MGAVSPVARTLNDQGPVQDSIRDALGRARKLAEDATLEVAASGLAPRSFGTEFLSMAAEGFEVVEQVPDLFVDVAEGADEFFPSVQENKDLFAASYPKDAPVLMLSFQGDFFDDTEILAPILKSAGVDVTFPSKLKGSHATPLTPDPLISTPFDSFDPLLPLRRTARQRLVKPLWDLRGEVLPFLERNLAKK